jgi:hypothetical protein
VGKTSHRDKREMTQSFRDNSLTWNKLWVITNHVTAKNLTKVVEATSDQVGLAFKDIREIFVLPCLYGYGPLPGSRFSFAKTSSRMCHRQYFLLHFYKHFRHYRGKYRLHSPTG